VLRRLKIIAALAVAAAGCKPADKRERLALWPKGAPGSERRRNEPEQAKDYWVRNIHDPSIEVFLPSPDKATGCGVVVLPGGGHRLLVYEPEGQQAADFLNRLGVAAFVLKYRLAREEGSTYSIEREARADAYRALRLVRSRAVQWRLDPQRIGIMGFSAGGELAGLVAFGDGAGAPEAHDAIDRLDGRPDFAIFIYPGPLAVPSSLPKTAPPAFLLAAADDECCAEPTLTLVQQYRDAGVSAEAHLLAKGGHGFNLGQRSELASVRAWPQRLADWLKDSGLLARTP
jgi:acetyl esterase/lipase